ncbi:hypothetical protein FIV53_01540 [Mycoplasma nasistruthionis]|uniref:Uncharacterized protein n=2 Tax=Mycoplasma nasistruthionis TaxID=353852 RepID=A0A4Y6I5U4_9MOLU|nr:hypothetical protein FIV53_01540 [Mycoplasma nasistruthionis]
MTDKSNKWIKIYFQVVEKLLKYHNMRQPLPFDKLKIVNYYKNYKLNETYGWKYQRHHIEEIYISGAILQTYKEAYAKGLSIIVTQEQHCLLHYLIVLAQTTIPNNGMLVQVDIATWDKFVKQQCEIFEVEYVPNWHDYLKSGLEF